MLSEKFAEVMVRVNEIGLGWVIVGFLGWVTFFSRFVVQWIASEIQKESVIPISFWYLSIIGSLLLLAYAYRQSDPIFMLCYLPNSLIYVRNLYLIYSKKKEAMES